jgi:hypothetical protein
MDKVTPPLDWWAYGGYAALMRQTGWALPRARRQVRKAIRDYGWNPVGHRGYQELRRRINNGELFDNDLQ